MNYMGIHYVCVHGTAEDIRSEMLNVRQYEYAEYKFSVPK